jgi:hypothetical protein
MIKDEGSENGRAILDWKQRKTMVVTLKNIREILNLDTSSTAKGDKDQDPHFIQYTESTTSKETRVMSMKRNEKDQKYEISYHDINLETGTTVDETVRLSVEMTFDEMKNLKFLLEYSIPSLIGWHCLYYPSIVNIHH